MTEAPQTGRNPFWQFSLSLYGRPGVPPSCLVLQDEAGVDVNVLLFCLWVGHCGGALSDAQTAAIVATVERWKQHVVVPLRGVRRELKAPPADFAAVAEVFRNRIKAVELEAERLQQEVLFTTHGDLARPADFGSMQLDLPAANAKTYARALGVEFPLTAINTLLGQLAQLPR
jgi:uncharacterized protein (TIGR02444 family)